MAHEILKHFGYYIESKYGDKVSIGYDNDTYLVTEWTHEDPQKDIDTLIADAESYKATYEATEYRFPRRREYPTWQEQLDMQYNDEINGTTTWKDTIAAIKTKHPKP